MAKRLFVSLFFLYIFIAPQVAEAQQSLARALAEAASATNQSVPQTVYPGMEMVSAFAVGTTLTYNIRLVNANQGQVSKAEVQQFVDEDIKPNGTIGVCSGPNIRVAIRDGATVSYVYLYANGARAARYDITEADCRRVER